MAQPRFTHAGLKRLPAYEYVGGLSNPSKMPCYGYSIPAIHCTIGARLRPVEGSTCHKCYALKGRYVFPNVIGAMERRFTSLTSNGYDVWATNMIQVMSYLAAIGETHFRWHDSGDLQCIEHLRAISEVARAVPGISHWLPTREYAIVRKYLLHDDFPPNLTVRLSAHMIDQPAPDMGLPMSGVSRTTTPTCPAPSQGGACLDCRKCWNANVRTVNYHLH